MTGAADRADVDRQLKFSAILPDFQSWLARMEGDSRHAEAALRLTRHAYGTGARQWVETAPGRGTAALVPVLIHGGYWRGLRAEDHRFVLPALARLGRGVANLEYRLMPAARMADLVSDAALGMARAAAVFPGVRLLPVGHSAGAHLALAALAHDPALAAHVAGVVAISGAFDLGLIARSFLQDELRLTAAEIARFTVSRPPAQPTLFVTGAAETQPFRAQARGLAAMAPHAAAIEVEPCHHMNILHAGLTEGAPLVPVIENWLAGERLPDRLEAPIP